MYNLVRNKTSGAAKVNYPKNEGTHQKADSIGTHAFHVKGKYVGKHHEPDGTVTRYYVVPNWNSHV